MTAQLARLPAPSRRARRYRRNGPLAVLPEDVARGCGRTSPAARRASGACRPGTPRMVYSCGFCRPMARKGRWRRCYRWWNGSAAESCARNTDTRQSDRCGQWRVKSQHAAVTLRQVALRWLPAAAIATDRRSPRGPRRSGQHFVPGQPGSTAASRVTASEAERQFRHGHSPVGASRDRGSSCPIRNASNSGARRRRISWSSGPEFSQAVTVFRFVLAHPGRLCQERPVIVGQIQSSAA